MINKNDVVQFSEKNLKCSNNYDIIKKKVE